MRKYLIGNDGAIYEGRDIFVKGAYVINANTGKIGVALMGNFETESGFIQDIKDFIQGASPTVPTEEQISSLGQLNTWLNYEYGIDIVGMHKDFYSETKCPENNLIKILIARKMLRY